MKTQNIFEVQIKGMYPYPCFTTYDIAEAVAAKNHSLTTDASVTLQPTIVKREFLVFNDETEFQSWQKGKSITDALDKLTEEEQALIAQHFKTLYTQR